MLRIHPSLSSEDKKTKYVISLLSFKGEVTLWLCLWDTQDHYQCVKRKPALKQLWSAGAPTTDVGLQRTLHPWDQGSFQWELRIANWLTAYWEMYPLLESAQELVELLNAWLLKNNNKSSNYKKDDFRKGINI